MHACWSGVCCCPVGMPAWDDPKVVMVKPRWEVGFQCEASELNSDHKEPQEGAPWQEQPLRCGIKVTIGEKM